MLEIVIDMREQTPWAFPLDVASVRRDWDDELAIAQAMGIAETGSM